jgi:hypothetical protein
MVFDMVSTYAVALGCDGTEEMLTECQLPPEFGEVKE